MSAPTWRSRTFAHSCQEQRARHDDLEAVRQVESPESARCHVPASTSEYDKTEFPMRKSSRGGRKTGTSRITQKRESAMTSAATPRRWCWVVLAVATILLVTACSGRAHDQANGGSSTSSVGPTTTADPSPAILAAYRAHWA